MTLSIEWSLSLATISNFRRSWTRLSILLLWRVVSQNRKLVSKFGLDGLKYWRKDHILWGNYWRLMMPTTFKNSCNCSLRRVHWELTWSKTSFLNAKHCTVMNWLNSSIIRLWGGMSSAILSVKKWNYTCRSVRQKNLHHSNMSQLKDEIWMSKSSHSSHNFVESISNSQWASSVTTFYCVTIASYHTPSVSSKTSCILLATSISYFHCLTAPISGSSTLTGRSMK